MSHLGLTLEQNIDRAIKTSHLSFPYRLADCAWNPVYSNLLICTSYDATMYLCDTSTDIPKQIIFPSDIPRKTLFSVAWKVYLHRFSNTAIFKCSRIKKYTIIREMEKFLLLEISWAISFSGNLMGHNYIYCRILQKNVLQVLSSFIQPKNICWELRLRR